MIEMIKLRYLILVCLIIIIGLCIYLYMDTSTNPSIDTWYTLSNNQSIGTLKQTLLVQYQDGSTSELDTYWLYHDDKIMEYLRYDLIGTSLNQSLMVDTSKYQLGFEIWNSNKQLLNNGALPYTSDDRCIIQPASTLNMYTLGFDPFTLVNYSYPDDTYSIVLKPSGTLIVNDRETNLPSSFRFSIQVIDERAINLDFN